jgi:hypothetical protein
VDARPAFIRTGEVTIEDWPEMIALGGFDQPICIPGLRQIGS